jgi:hypothetical protein
MRLTGSIAIILLQGIGASGVYAQYTKEVPLKPIYKNGWKYFYGGQKMNSVYALQIPLQSLDDKEINERFKKFKRFQVYRIFVYIPSIVYLFTYVGSSRRGYAPRGHNQAETYWILLAVGVAGDITFNELGHHQMAKAIDIYNVKISNKSTLGLSFNRLLNQNYPSLSYQFKF